MSDTLDDEIAALEALRADNLAQDEKARKAQYLVDLKARVDLEGEHGTVTAVKLSRFVKGQPTQVLVRAPSREEYKRYKSQAFAAANSKGGAGQIVAGEMLANACWIYPAEAEEKAALLEVASGLLSSITLAAVALAEGKAEDEGKG